MAINGEISRITQGQTLYEVTKQNLEIVAGANETFFCETSSESFKNQYGSFNYLELINDSGQEIYVDLDGQTTRRRVLFGKSVLVIKAEENLFFNTIKITNADAVTAIAANGLIIISRIVR